MILKIKGNRLKLFATFKKCTAIFFWFMIKIQVVAKSMFKTLKVGYSTAERVEIVMLWYRNHDCSRSMA